MKQKQFQKQERRTCPHFLLKAFTLLAMLVVGMSASWAQTQIAQFRRTAEYEANNEDRYFLAQNNEVYFYALGLKNNGAWDWVENDVISQKDINGVRFVFIPQDIKNEGEANQSYIKIQFASGKILPGDILSVDCSDAFTNGDAAEIGYRVGGSNINVTRSVTDQNAYTLTHTITQNEIIQDGDNQYIRIGKFPYHNTYIGTITITRPAGFTVTFGPNDASAGMGTLTATVGGNPITSGTRVPSGTQVQFTATPSSSDYRHWGYDVNGSRDWKFQNPYTVTADVKVEANFTPGIKLNAYPNNGNWGSINISGGGESGTSIHITPYPGTVTFTATPNAGYKFVGWYEDVDCNNLATSETTLTYTNSDAILTNSGTINRWAKFEKDNSGPKTIGKPECDCTGAGTGINLFPLDKLNAQDGMTIETVAGGVKLNPGQYNDHYVSFVFDQAYNLSDLAGWTIGDASAQGNVVSVQFMRGVDPIMTCYRDAGNREDTNEIKADLTEVTEIRIYFKAGTESVVSKFEFRIQHGAWTAPTLSGISNDMKLYVGAPLNLDITNDAGFWREYTDGNFNNELTTSVLYNTYNPRYTFEANTLTVGQDYYFGVKDGRSCALGNYHFSDMVKVHVKVINQELYDVTFNAAGGWGVAGSMKITDINTGTVVSTTEKEIESIAIEKGHVGRVQALELGNGTYLKSWTVTRAKDIKYIDGETETVDIYDGIPSGGVVWVDVYNGFDYSSNGVIKNIQANYGRPVTISFNMGDSPVGTAKIVFDGQDTWTSSTSFREETVLQLKAAPNDVDTHKFKQWNLSFYDGDTQVGETKWYFSNQKVVDLKLDRSYTGGAPYTRVVAEPVFEEGSERVDQNVNITVNGETRSYHVYAPIGLEGKSPVLFSLHGKGGDVLTDYTAGAANVQDFKDWADRDKFIAIYPQGKVRNDQTDWLANGAYDNEDVKFFDAIIEDLKTKFTIDDNRVYMAGYAEGAAMTYTTAFTSEKFAAFATINGHQEGDTHLQHYGAPIGSPRPVPFVHIQQTNEGNMATIVDNMVARNGANPVPTVTNIEQVDFSSPCIKYVYDAVPGSYPFVYYHVQDVWWDFPTVSFDDAGKGTYDGMNGVSRGVFWNFLKNYSRPTTSYADRCRIEFMPNVEKFNNTVLATDHGWKSDIDGEDRIILQYGDKSGETIDAAGVHGTNVYHTIQLGKGAHQFQFTSNSTAPNTSTMWVTVTIDKVGDIDPATGVVTPCNVQVIQRDYNIGAVSFNINREEEGVGEYRITFQWNNSDESDLGIANGKGITISGISFQNNNGQDKGKQHTETSKEFTRYYNYHGRLIAQWNFDLADGVRFNYPSLADDRWKASGDIPANGVVTYSYINNDITNEANPVELTYDGTHPIAVAAGLKFSSVDPEKVQIQVTFENGVMTKSQLVLDAGVKMTVPYVRNTYRNDVGNWDTKAVNPNLKETGEVDGKKQYDVISPANTELFDKYDDCMHHINRDIIYISSSPIVWDAIDNWVNGVWNEKFFTGGEDHIEGRMYEKMNYLGTQDGPCVIEFVDKITIDRIGVNRNFVSSFYTEYIYEETGQAKPYPGFRYVAGPSGQRIADVGAAAGMYESAIAMTYGGWQYNSNIYKDYDGSTVSDTWNELNVYQGGDRGEGSQNRNIGKIDDLASIPIASDGFPVYSRMESSARSENVNPADNTKYFDKSDGLFKFTTDNGGSLAYQENYTPWSLPARGAHVKFEPTLPGVLNIDVLMKGDADYWIADEFGKIISDNVFVKTGTTGETHRVDRTNGHFKVTKTDYVKYSFDVYPGKTYYLFTNNGDLGVAGFYYEPYVYRHNKVAEFPDGSTDRQKEAIELDRDNVGIYTATLGADASGATYVWDKTEPHGYTNQCAFVGPNEPGFPADGIKQKMATDKLTYDNKAVHVIYERDFAAGRWQTICLPYSMNNLQMKQQFGDGAKVVMLRDVQPANSTNGTTAYFVYHMNQDIIAGYPYLIWPSKSTSRIETNAYLGEGTGDNPSAGVTPLTIKGEGPNLVTFPTDGNTYDGLGCYKFVANFKTGVTVPKGSYVMSGGKLVRLNDQTDDIEASPFMGYLEYNGPDFRSPEAAKYRIEMTNYVDVNGDAVDEATSIEDMLLQSGIVGGKTNVYSVNGQMVRQNTDDLSGLAKGVYIVNGKKYIVR